MTDKEFYSLGGGRTYTWMPGAQLSDPVGMLNSPMPVRMVRGRSLQLQSANPTRSRISGGRLLT